VKKLVENAVFFSEMEECEWSMYAQVLDEKHTDMQAELTMMKELVWNSWNFSPEYYCIHLLI
jgi:hypothetical protein